jgi:hypothetical protein
MYSCTVRILITASCTGLRRRRRSRKRNVKNERTRALSADNKYQQRPELGLSVVVSHPCVHHGHYSLERSRVWLRAAHGTRYPRQERTHLARTASPRTRAKHGPSPLLLRRAGHSAQVALKASGQRVSSYSDDSSAWGGRGQ